MTLQGRAVRFASIFAFLLALLAAQASAATHSWTGAAGPQWSNPNNWSPATVPVGGDTLVFPFGAANASSVNDLPAGTAFGTLTLQGQNYNLSGNGIVVTSAISTTYPNPVFALPIDFQANAVTLGGGAMRFTGGVSGSGTITLNAGITLEGPGSFSGTLTSSRGSTLTLANGASYPAMAVTGNVFVTGSGAIGAYAANNFLMPSGTIQASGLAVSNAVVETINGTTPGSGYGQVVVQGAVTSVAGASIGLNVSPSFVPVLGQVFTVIDNDGTDPIAPFANAAQGALYQMNGANFNLSYTGGDGNDVTLTVTTAPRAWTGASSALWSDPANWSPAGVPQAGDRLLFPAGATNLANTNDIAGLSVSFLVITGSGYTLQGNALGITAILDGGPGTGNRIALPLDFAAPTVGINGGSNAPLVLAGVLSGAGTINVFRQVQLEAANTFSGTVNSYFQLTLANGATLPATINNNNALLGAGTVGALTSQLLQPSGILATGNLTQNSTFLVTLNGNSAGTGYPQVQATGTVTLGASATLNVSATAGLVPYAGQELVLVANDGTDAITGRFANLAEGALVSLAGCAYRVSYVGGDGNDISLTCTAPKPAPPQPPLVAGLKPVDFDGDGRGDLGFTSASGGGAWLMHGLDRADAGAITGGTGATLHVLGDFDGDGHTDALWRMPDASYRITLMNGLAAGTSTLVLASGSGWEVVGAGDFNGDGKADLLWKHPTRGYGVWLMNGAAAIASSAIVPPGAGFEIQLLADFDGDRSTDVLWRHADGRTKVTIMRGVNAFPAVDLTAATTWTPTLAGDLDGDGKADLLWSDTDGSVAAWLMNGVAAKAYASLAAGGSGWSIALVGDLDGDGRDDLVWKRADGSIAAWLMNGTTATGWVGLVGAGTGWTPVALRDLDGDGRQDVLLTHTDGSVAGWLMHGLKIESGAVLMTGGSGWSLLP